MAETLQLSAIITEAVVCFLAFQLGYKKKRKYAYALGFTFGTYAFYDLTRLFNLPIAEEMLAVFFFTATLSALYAILHIRKLKK